MKAYLPWYLPETFDEWLENVDIESELFNEPYRVPNEILDWTKDNYWEYITANEDRYIEDFAYNFVATIENYLPNKTTLTRLDKGQLDEDHLIEVEVEDPVELFENGDLILSNLDEIYEYLDKQQDSSVSSEDLEEFLNKGDVQLDSEDEIDKEIENELVNFDFESMDPDLAGALIIYFTNISLGELLWDAMEDLYWYEYADYSELLKKVNEVFNLNPPADNFLDLQNYTEDGGEFEYSADSPGQLKLQFESLRKLKTRLQVILEDFSPDAFNYMKKEYGLSDEQVKSELAIKTQIDNMFSKDSDIYRQALQKMAPDEIDHHESDLYLKKNEVSDKLISNYKFRNNVTIFRDQIDGVLWYEIPFAYHREFDEKVDESLVLRLKKLTEGDVINFADFKRKKSELSPEGEVPENAASEEPQELNNDLIKDYSNNENKTSQDVEVGDILYTSWGYDMTIVDFYRVTERKKASIRLEALAYKAVSGEPGNNKIVPMDKVVPDEKVDGKLFRLTKYGVCQIDGHTARYWNGKPKYYNTYD